LGYLFSAKEMKMKLLFVLVFALTFLMTPLAQQTDGFIQNYDKFQDYTTWEVRYSQNEILKGGHLVIFSAVYKFDGKVPPAASADLTYEDFLEIAYVEQSMDNVATDLEVRFLVDGEIVGPFYAHEAKSSVSSLGKAHFCRVNGGALSIIEKIAKAKTVEAQIGSVEFQLSASAIGHMKELWAKIPKTPEDLASVYDKTKNATTRGTHLRETVKVKNAVLVCSQMSYTFSGKAQSAINNPMAIFKVAPQEFKPLSEDLKLTLYVDGKAVGPFETTSTARNDEPGLTYRVTDATTVIESIAKGTTVTGKLGDIELEFTPHTINQIKILYAEMHKK
jgi:hypothetical protein